MGALEHWCLMTDDDDDMTILAIVACLFNSHWLASRNVALLRQLAPSVE